MDKINERDNEENINIIRNCVPQRRRGGDREINKVNLA